MDSLAEKAREAHEASLASLRLAKQQRFERDVLIRRLRREDPKKWSYSRLAKLIGCSPELIPKILQRSRTQQ